MGDIAVVGSWQKSSLLAVMAGIRGWQWQHYNSISWSEMHHGRTVSMAVKNKKMKMKMAFSDVSASTSTYSSRISTNIPLYEHPGVMYPTFQFLALSSRLYK